MKILETIKRLVDAKLAKMEREAYPQLILTVPAGTDKMEMEKIANQIASADHNSIVIMKEGVRIERV